jgi:Lon protease-like protein
MKIPLFPLGLVLFPGTALRLHIFESRYKEMIGECLAQSKAFGVVRAQPEGLAVIGCTAQIVRVLQEYPDGRLDILCRGADRFEIETLDNARSFLQAEVDFFEDEDQGAGRSLREKCAALHFEALELMESEGTTLCLDLNRPISFQLASAAPCDTGFKQELLGLRSDAERSERLLAFYHAMLPKLRRGVHATKVASGNGHVM